MSKQPTFKTWQQFVSAVGLTIEARATSTSGRWIVLIGSHLRQGLPCYDVLMIRSTDLFVDVHHFHTAQTESRETYDQAKAEAYTKARAFFEECRAKLQSPASPEEGEGPSGLKIHNPDGSTEDYTIN